jgi:hypothetical protein
MKKTAVVLFVCLFLLVGMAGRSYAESIAQSADVLPKGVFRAGIESDTYLPVDTRFDAEGHPFNLDRYFNATLNSSIFSGLSALDPLTGGPGTANIGRSVVNFDYNFAELTAGLSYGVTDRLTVGIAIPYEWWSADVTKVRLNTKNATVGKNPFFGQPGDPFGGAPLIPIKLGGIPLTTGDAQALIGPGLTINGKPAIPGYGYERLESVSDNGIEDIQVGARYQYFRNDNWKLASQFGVVFPTGTIKDPDNLVGRWTGTGAYALSFGLNNDYTGIKNLVLDASVRYDYFLPMHQVVRITNFEHPIVPLTSEDNAKIELGDILTIYGSGTYTFAEGWDLSVAYRYQAKVQKDKASGTKKLAYSLYSFETDWTDNLISGGISYSTIPLFKAKKFPVPLKAGVEYQYTFAGTNNDLKVEIVALKLAVFF